MSDLYYGIAIMIGILIMVICVKWKPQSRSVSADKPKDPRRFDGSRSWVESTTDNEKPTRSRSEDASALGTNAQGVKVEKKPIRVSGDLKKSYWSEKVE